MVRKVWLVSTTTTPSGAISWDLVTALRFGWRFYRPFTSVLLPQRSTGSRFA